LSSTAADRRHRRSQAYFETLDNPTNKAFVARYRDKFGKDKPINAIGEATL
jgi:urea transport system substrate-binding protein